MGRIPRRKRLPPDTGRKSTDAYPVARSGRKVDPVHSKDARSQIGEVCGWFYRIEIDLRNGRVRRMEGDTIIEEITFTGDSDG